MEKKNKIAISIFAAVCVISTVVGNNLIKQKKEYEYDQLAVMIKQDDGSYIRSNMSTFGNEDYEFDHAVCVNGTTVTANPNGGVNLNLLGTDKCTVYLKKKIKTVIDLIKASAQPSMSSMYSAVEPTNEISSVTDDNFSKNQETYTVDATHQSYYITYSVAYNFDGLTTTSSGTDYPTYTLTDGGDQKYCVTEKYSDIYGSLAGKYIVNYEGHNGYYDDDSSKIDRIYKVVSATANSITYIPSSYTMEFTDNGTTGIYTTEDDYGTSYYFRGNVTNNYVKFGKWTENVYRGYSSDTSAYKDYFTKEECQADGTYNNGCNKSPVAGKDMYWRIIRINEDGTLRLMYDGTEAHANGTKSLDRFALPYQRFNTGNSSNAYVGYMYGNVNGTTYDAVHTNTTNSAIKTALETWYEKNFVGTEYESKVGNMSFCNDRSRVAYNGTVGSGIGTTQTYYGAYGRIVMNNTPSLVCPQKENDLFTSNASIQGGNGKLDKPVGLLTADEVALAGGVYGSSNGKNRGYYMNKGYQYWLGSPYYYSSYATESIVNDAGNLSGSSVYNANGAVPVINLSSAAAKQLIGSGTMDNPYIVTGTLAEGYHIVTFDYNYSGSNWTAEECKSPMIFTSATNTCTKIVKEGEPYGELPVPNVPSIHMLHFAGWYTEPDISSGTKITSYSIVNSSASNQTLYAYITGEPTSSVEPEKQKQ